MNFEVGSLVVGILAVLAFAAMFRVFRLAGRAAEAVRTANEAVAVMRDSDIEDLEKERLVQSAAVSMFGHFAMLALSAAIILAAPLAVVWLGDAVGLASFGTTMALLLSWPFISGATLVFGLGYLFVRQTR